MLKKFVPLTADASPSNNPNEIRTYMGNSTRSPEWQIETYTQECRKCRKPANSTISKVLTIEDEIRRLHEKAKESRFRKPFQRRKCKSHSDYEECVVPMRTPQELKLNAIIREKFIKATVDLNTRIHEASPKVDPEEVPSLVQLKNPGIDDGDETDYFDGEEESEYDDKQVKPIIASPTCSLDVIYVPPKKLLELKRPKSGMYFNQTEPPQVEPSRIPYSSYNPRLLQQKFDDQNLDKIDIMQDVTDDENWTWDIGMQKRESELNREYMRSIRPEFKACDDFEPQVYEIPRDLQKTFMVEIVFGTDALIPEEPKKKIEYYKRPMEIACIYVAYIESYRMTPDFWEAPTMDGVMASGQRLVARSTLLNYKAHDNDFDIIPQVVDKQATIGIKIHYSGSFKEEPNVFKSLALYFSKYNAAILYSKKLYLLIWKRCQNTYFIYDPNGRNKRGLRDFANGKSTLMVINHIEHVVHLIMNYSDISLDSDYNLYEIFLVNYGKISNTIASKPNPKRTRKIWAVVNNTYALIPAANNGLQQPTSGNANNPSMIIALMALLYSGIETPSTWRMEVVDDLVKLGQNYYKAYVKKLKLKKKQQLNITDVPDKILMGAFHATIKKGPFLFTGHVVNCNYYRDSQLTVALRELFSGKWEAALLQIDSSVLAIWRDANYYYVFDSFRRGRAGQVLDLDDFLTKGVACLQMHTDFDSLCRVLLAKAIPMRRGGKFFMHGIKICCIRPNATAVVKNKYKQLQLTFPTIKSEIDRLPKFDKREKEKKNKRGKKIRLQRTFSIQSVPDADRIPEFESIDVVYGLLEEIICEIVAKFPEDRSKRTRKYKQAAKVLLKSDKSYLEKLQYNLKHGDDYDNMYETFRTQPEPPKRAITLEEELLIPSNFETLPDGAWIIYSTYIMPMIDDRTAKLGGLLSIMITAALTSKYKISTWNPELIDYAIEETNTFSTEFDNYEKVLEMVVTKKIPKIQIGDTKYAFTVQKVLKSTFRRSLRQVLLESLINHNRLIIICQRFNCLIMKRYNFLYMFIGFPCNAVGVRKFGPGHACMLRFVELDSLIRRIDFGCNPSGEAITNYVVVALKVRDVTVEPPRRFKQWPASYQEKMYNAELLQDQDAKRRKLDKIRFLDNELRKENERITKFLTLKQRKLLERKLARERSGKQGKCVQAVKSQAKNVQMGKQFYFVEDGEEEGDEGGEEALLEGEEEEEIPLKHQPGKKLPRMVQFAYKPHPILYGYRLRQNDCHFKIQGTTALEGRAEAKLEEIKTCFFASTFAVLYAILRPLNEWSAQRIDRVIENALAIAKKVKNMTTAFERIIKNVTVDDYEFDVWVKLYDVMGIYGTTLDRKITRVTQSRHYLLLQTPNATFAIFRDDYYHLFDPYKTLEKLQEEEEEVLEELGDKQDQNKAENEESKEVKAIRRYRDRNTASWVLFADAVDMVRYIDARMSDPQWEEKEEYTMHIVDIISYKKASSESRILQLLTDLSVPIDTKADNAVDEEAQVCAHSESLRWLDLENCLPVWSRMNRRNTSGRYRNLPLTKHKRYDIEIDGRLWSLWGTIHPQAVVFHAATRGKQYLACNVIACCAASVYNPMDWSSQLLDSIVVSGDRYHRESLANIKRCDYEFSLEDLNIECALENIAFVVHIEHVAYGKLYCQPTNGQMNLAEALMYFFSHYQFGIVQCNRRSLAIGRTFGFDGGYFMFDCQSREHPLFPKGQGASYILRTRHLQVLLYCIVVTLNIPYYNMQFTIHKVQMFREGEVLDEEGSEENDENPYN